MLTNLYRQRMCIYMDISRMKDKVYRTERAIRNGELPSTDIRHYCSDYGVRYRQSIADKCLREAIAAAQNLYDELDEKIWNAELDREYFSMC